MKKQYRIHGPILDQPVAGLLANTKQRGLLQNTLVLWCTEFGHVPTFQKEATDRGPNLSDFTTWMARVGVKAPYSYGATNEFGYKASDKITTVYDVHATILHLLGLDHRRLTFYHNGIEGRLTDVHGKVLDKVLN